jgi:hypothetical protein
MFENSKEVLQGEVVYGTVEAMDGRYEPPWMGSRRVP